MDQHDPDLRREQRILAHRHDDLVAAAYQRLERRVPAMREYTDRQLEHTRRDLSYTLRFLEAALLVEDAAVFGEYATWLRALLTVRGVPADVLRTSFEAQAEALDTDMVEARAMLLGNLPG